MFGFQSVRRRPAPAPSRSRALAALLVSIGLSAGALAAEHAVEDEPAHAAAKPAKAASAARSEASASAASKAGTASAEKPADPAEKAHAAIERAAAAVERAAAATERAAASGAGAATVAASGSESNKSASRAAARSESADAEKPAEAKAADAKAAEARTGEGKPAQRAAMKPVPMPDPLEHVRELLAEKLGAKPTSKAGGPYDVRVAARSPEPVAEPRRVSAPAAHKANAEAPAASASAAAMAVHHWSYDGEDGPTSWAQLRPEFSLCSRGTRQSPIDIRDGIAVQLDAVKFDYRPSGFRVIDNGHTVQVNVAPGNSIEVLGRRYELLQFHFHRPSEERIDGRQFDMVVHLVHKDPEGRLAVIAVLLDRGSAQPIVQAVWNNLPLEKNEEVAAQAALDLNQLLPDDRRYYTYMGSLTTPPCSEGVLWMVMKKPVSIAAEQINVFSRLYPMNARPLQSASGRLIKESQ